MKRRSFIKNLSLASLSLPFVSNGIGMQGITKKLFDFSKNADFLDIFVWDPITLTLYNYQKNINVSKCFMAT